MQKQKISKLFVSVLLCATSSFAQEQIEEKEVMHCAGHTINFSDVSMVEFIRFVSRISGANFIFDHKDLEFNITFATGRAMSAENVLNALIQMLRVRGFSIEGEDGYHVVHKLSEEGKEGGASSELVAPRPVRTLGEKKGNQEFFLYKLKYHQGQEIEEAIKKVALDLQNKPDAPQKLIQAIQSMQWVKATNSLLCSGDAETVGSFKKLIDSLDVPLRQVFIEVLVIETDVRKATEFGLEWAAGGNYQGKIAFGAGNFVPTPGQAPFAGTLQQVNQLSPSLGLNQIPLGSGFDMGVIGDIIMHKGLSHLTLGSLVSALQADGDSTIVLNQKIITQDNKNSTIFVGDNIPFTGSVVQTVGHSQQTTSNIEYRDIGVSLSITPMLGEEDIITLDLSQEITESLTDNQSASAAVNGIRTTKTNMMTHVHVPDKHFLVLSGMIRNANAHHKSGVPCLGGLPVIGAAFSKTRKRDEKRNVIIFVRPHIIHSFDDYKKLTQAEPLPL